MKVVTYLVLNSNINGFIYTGAGADRGDNVNAEIAEAIGVIPGK